MSSTGSFAEFSTPAQVAGLYEYGLNDHFLAAMRARIEPGMSPGRVVRVDGQSSLIQTANGQLRAEPAPHLYTNLADAVAMPCVGDWVLVRPRPQHATDLIEAVLPRTSTLTRMGEEVQVLAANVDTAFIVQAADNLNLRRMEREISQVWESGVAAVMVLTKRDLVVDVLGVIEQAESVSPDAPVHCLDAISGEGVESLRRYTAGNQTIVLIGASGVGKSTLANKLIGTEVLKTGAVRASDSRGRHTTTSRHLLPLPGGGVLIDTPGIRSVGLTADAGDGVSRAFQDIEDLAPQCRFRDCGHQGEPGCAIAEAVATGLLSTARLESYRKLAREVQHMRVKQDKAARAAESRKNKAWARRMRQRMQARDKFGRPQ